MPSPGFNAITASTASDAALQTQIVALRESLKRHREQAQKLWDACAQGGEAASDARRALGQFTEQLLKGQMDEAYA
jgi:hypothetical protein